MRREKQEYTKGGNIYNKYASKNPITWLLMKRFFRDLDNLLNSIDINRALDVGCGEGYITKHLSELNNKIYIEGVDASEEILEIARELNQGVKFSKGSIYNLKYGHNSFDLVLAIEILEHLEEPKKAIEELKRVSKKYVIVSVPNGPYFRMANMLRLKYLSRFGNTPGHIQNWTKKGFSNLLSGHFKKVRVKTSTLWLIALCE